MTTTTTPTDRHLATGSWLMGFGAVAFIGYAVVFFILNFTDRFLELGIGPKQVDVGRAEIQAFSPSLFHYISHLHIAVAGFIAATGLALAVLTGSLLFSVRAQEYAEVGYLQAKLVLVLVGLLSALMIHRAYGPTLEGASQARLRFHALLSLGCWLGALACGRLIAFAID